MNPRSDRRDLHKKETCRRCEDTFERIEMRGAANGDWLCVPCWEAETGQNAPPPLPGHSGIVRG